MKQYRDTFELTDTDYWFTSCLKDENGKNKRYT